MISINTNGSLTCSKCNKPLEHNNFVVVFKFLVLRTYDISCYEKLKGTLGLGISKPLNSSECTSKFCACSILFIITSFVALINGYEAVSAILLFLGVLLMVFRIYIYFKYEKLKIG